eukprot:268797-Chlamydomonas_euryale.AAC.1
MVEKSTPDAVRFANGSSIESTHVGRVWFSLGDFADCDTFNTLELDGFDLVLGKSWLSRHDPHISWTDNSIRLRQKGRSRLVVHEKDEKLQRLMALTIESPSEFDSVAKNEQMYLAVIRPEKHEPTSSGADTPATRRIEELLKNTRTWCPTTKT